MKSVHAIVFQAHWLLTTCMSAEMHAYSTNFSTIEDNMWTYDKTCFHCSGKNADQCTRNNVDSVLPASIAHGAGLTIKTTSLSKNANGTDCSSKVGGHSGHLTFKPALTFGTIRVKSRYFPGSKSQVKTGRAFIGLEDSSSGSITMSFHGKGATPSGAPASADWTHWMQSSCYQHGDDKNKQFTELDSSINVADDFNTYELVWTSTSVTWKVNGKQVRKITDPSKVPQKPMYVRLHARSIAYSGMPAGTTFESYIQEFQFEPLKTTIAV